MEWLLIRVLDGRLQGRGKPGAQKRECRAEVWKRLSVSSAEVVGDKHVRNKCKYNGEWLE